MARVLVVEDNPANLKLVTMLLDRAGHEVLAALDAETALTLARQVAPDLVLMDVQLPGMDGLTATALLKADPVTARIPIIALTADAMVGDAERLMAQGFDDAHPKPIAPAGLLATVARLSAAGGASRDPQAA